MKTQFRVDPCDELATLDALMRFTSSLLALLFTLPLVAVSRLAAADAPPAPAEKAPVAKTAGADPDATELGDKMDDIGSAFKKLKKQIADPSQNASSIQLVEKMRKGVAAASQQTPVKTQDLPQADRAKFLADYDEGMKKFSSLLEQLETALKANDNAAADKLVKDLNSLQRESHKEFRRPKQ